jgi:hypothetical protein
MWKKALENFGCSRIMGCIANGWRWRWNKSRLEYELVPYREEIAGSGEGLKTEYNHKYWSRDELEWAETTELRNFPHGAELMKSSFEFQMHFPCFIWSGLWVKQIFKASIHFSRQNQIGPIIIVCCYLNFSVLTAYTLIYLQLQPAKKRLWIQIWEEWSNVVTKSNYLQM